jgi:hypothetical protein
MIKIFTRKQSPVLESTKTCIAYLYPVGIWLVLFSLCRYIPPSIRPLIHVELLPWLDNLLFNHIVGLTLMSLFLSIFGMLVISKIPYWQVYILSPFLLFCLNGLLKTTSSPVLDFGLFLPYGVLHYLSPFILTLYCLYREELHVAKSYLHGLGWMNVFGVITQVLLPCAPPWYNLKYGVITADYSMPGDPGGLCNVDKLFNSNLFTSIFNSSPLVFGAMPCILEWLSSSHSLHFPIQRNLVL